jgi:hypothetical protein
MLSIVASLPVLFLVIAAVVFAATRREGPWTWLGVLLFSAGLWLLVLIWLVVFVFIGGGPSPD